MTAIGKLVFGVLILALLGLGAYGIFHKHAANTAQGPTQAQNGAVAAPTANIAELQKDLAEALPYPKRLPAVQEYIVKDKTLDLELSEWVGYSGLIAYNGGLAPNPNSDFTKKTGYLLKMAVSEDESWDRLVTGKLAASSTTADVLAVYGKQLGVTVPVQIDFSRGADAIVVRNEIAKINDLAGKIVVCAQFTESDFLLRDLAREAGVEVTLLSDLNTTPDPAKINVVVTDQGDKAGDVFIKDLKGGFNKLAGCVTWSPKTEEVVEGSEGKARILTTNRNLLIIADVLLVNKPFATKNPEAVQALVTGVIEGNKMVETNSSAYAAVVEKAFKWEKGKFSNEFKKVHLSNLPENLAFFKGTIDSAGSFPGIYQMSMLSYGPSVIKDETPSEYFSDLKFLTALEETGSYKDQRIALAPIKIGSGGQALEQNPLLSKNIRFYFEPNKNEVDAKNAQNVKNYEDIKNLLKLSPGSTIILRGHVDDAQVESFRQRGGDAFVQQMALKAIQLSKDRSDAVKAALIGQGVDESRLTTIGKGWEEPVAKSMPNETDDVRRQKSEKNRRVEAVWVTIE